MLYCRLPLLHACALKLLKIFSHHVSLSFILIEALTYLVDTAKRRISMKHIVAAKTFMPYLRLIGSVLQARHSTFSQL